MTNSGGHPAKVDPQVAKLHKVMKTAVELTGELNGRLTEDRYLALRAASLGLMFAYSELTGLPAPDTVVGNGDVYTSGQLCPKFMDAVRLTRHNIHDVAKWTDGTIIEVAHPTDEARRYEALAFSNLEGKTTVTLGSYIVKDKYRGFYSLTSKEFQAMMEQVG